MIQKQYNADGKKKSSALYTVYEFDFMEIYTGFLSGTKNISALSRDYIDSRYPQSSLIMDIEVEPKIKTLVLFFARWIWIEDKIWWPAHIFQQGDHVLDDLALAQRIILFILHCLIKSFKNVDFYYKR